MKNMKSLTIVAAGGALGFIVLLAGSAVTGARPWPAQPYPSVVSAATQTAPMPSEMHAQHMMKGGTGQRMMSGGMACQMMSGEMSCPHKEMKALVGELVKSFEAIRSEQDPRTLKSKLAAHETLLKQLQAKSDEKCPMMGGGSHEGQ